jgi:hypothetical protein
MVHVSSDIPYLNSAVSGFYSLGDLVEGKFKAEYPWYPYTKLGKDDDRARLVIQTFELFRRLNGFARGSIYSCRRFHG